MGIFRSIQDLPHSRPFPRTGATSAASRERTTLFACEARPPSKLTRPAILPKPIGEQQKGAISLGFERHRGFYELVCARFAPAGSGTELVSMDSGYVDAGRRFAGPPHR